MKEQKTHSAVLQSYQNATGVKSFQAPKWQRFQAITHGFFTRIGGVSAPPYDSLNLSLSTEDDPANVAQNKRILSGTLNINEDNLVFLKQVHNSDILLLDSAPSPLNERAFDGIVTNRPGWALVILSADCLPILMFDPKKRAIGAGHAGWRGTLKGIGSSLALAMQSAFGSSPENLEVIMGPAIGPCCYRVGDEVFSRFSEKERRIGFKSFNKNPGRFVMDLAAINRQQLLESGLKDENIIEINLCTSCRNDLFFSHRGSGGQCGRQANIILLR